MIVAASTPARGFACNDRYYENNTGTCNNDTGNGIDYDNDNDK